MVTITFKHTMSNFENRTPLGLIVTSFVPLDLYTDSSVLSSFLNLWFFVHMHAAIGSPQLKII